MNLKIVTVHARHAAFTLVLTLSVLVVPVFAAACSTTEPDDTVTLRVFAASSLTEALTEAADAFEAENDGVRVEMHFAGSSQLRAQIEEGAEADVFVSADPDHLSAISRLLIASSITTFASNEMVVAMADSEQPLQSLEELAEPGVKIVIALPDVPAGRYARSLIAELGQREGFPHGYEETVLANIVSEETNVRAVLAKVLLGEADAGFVYRTDLRDSGLSSLGIISQGAVDIVYAGAALDDSPRQSTAEGFLDFLILEQGGQILLNHGFHARSERPTVAP